MTLIIDGYNLLHASGVFGAERGARGFEQSRMALLDVLVELLGDDATNTIVVFDAAKAPNHLPQRHSHGPLQVWYARDYPDADALIEELLEQHKSPQELVIVSSDRRIQRAARRQRARTFSSDTWLAEQRRRQNKGTPNVDKKPPSPSPCDVEVWKQYFGL